MELYKNVRFGVVAPRGDPCKAKYVEFWAVFSKRKSFITFKRNQPV